jgi:hypothetical protein
MAVSFVPLFATRGVRGKYTLPVRVGSGGEEMRGEKKRRGERW